MPIRALAPLHHACHACGGSCQGVRARVLPEERLTIEAAAAALGVEDPIAPDGVLRQPGDRCAFLDEHARCRIHATFGAAHKPAICRQYPLVRVEVEDGVRVGVDPGCYHAADPAPAVDDVPRVGHPAALDPAAVAAERAILALLARPGITVAGALGALGGGDPTSTRLPPGLAARWTAALTGADLPALLALPGAGPAVRLHLGPLAAAAWTREPGSPLRGDEDAWAIEAARRLVFLRLLHRTLPFPPVAAALSLLGAAAISWAPSPAGFAPGVAAWSRALRTPPLIRALVPTPEAFRSLVGG